MNTRRLLVVIVFLSALAAHAGTIEYVPTNLPDVTSGEDLWRYDYTVSGFAFLQSEFFDIYFSPALYSTLAAEPAPNADWDVLVLEQPRPGILPPFDRGIFDSFVLTDGPSLSGVFSVSFIYLGSGTPGAQEFEVFDGLSNTIETGFTRAPAGTIPEPSTFALLLIGLVAWALRFRHRSAVRN